MEIYKPLSHAIDRGDLQAVKDFLDESLSALTAYMGKTDTPLLKSCSCGQLEIVKELLQRMTPEQVLHKVYYNKDGSSVTPLAIAAINGNLEIAKALVAKYPKLLEIPSFSGQSIPVNIAARDGHKELGRYLFHKTPISILLAELSASFPMPFCTEFSISPWTSWKRVRIYV